MSILGWIFFGLIAGFIASKIVSAHGQGCLLNIALGLIGAVVGGAMFSALGEQVFWHFSLKSMFVAVIGAVVVLVLYHMVTGRHPLR
jgi:uncharacterized membrane protein YeaQ/YmgE (transglycosylase-associated protein family)